MSNPTEIAKNHPVTEVVFNCLRSFSIDILAYLCYNIQIESGLAQKYIERGELYACIFKTR